MIAKNLNVNEKGHLTFAGLDTVDLAREFSTPLYLIDEDGIVERVREYISAVKRYISPESNPCYAGKALCYTDLYRTLARERMWIDVVSAGELYTAKNAGFDLSHAMFHSNNKTDRDIEIALDEGVGRFVSDSLDELVAISAIAEKKGVEAKVLIRLTPGIDPHTHKAINTGTIDSKFGVAIETGDAEKLVEKALKMKNVDLLGFHCHIGSQIFETEPFIEAVDKMLGFAKVVLDKFSFVTREIDLGGGMAVRYLESDPEINYTENIKAIGQRIDKVIKESGIKKPTFYLEPGRSIVADNGMTLYTVGSVKVIEGYKTYVSVDGGMADNPRYALYESPYTVLSAKEPEKRGKASVTVAGRCCESGDIIQENVPLPEVERGDVLAVLTTGAYNFSMASNYNRLLRPPLVTISKGECRISVKGESFEDILRNDV